MHWLVTIVGALLIALIVGAAFSASGSHGRWPGLVSFFATLFLGTLAFGVWAEPVGPTAFGFPWLMFLVIAIFIGLLLASATPGTGRNQRHLEQRTGSREPNSGGETRAGDDDLSQDTARDPNADAAGAATAVSLFFWVFAVLAIAIIAVRLWAMPEV